jgi:hypothetical protein
MPVRISDLEHGDLFRIDSAWYRLAEIKGKKATISVVGDSAAAAKEVVHIPSNTEITELSVLNKKIQKG